MSSYFDTDEKKGEQQGKQYADFNNAFSMINYFYN